MKQSANKIKRYLKLYCLIIKFSLMQNFIYRIDSMFMALTPIVWFLGTIVFVSVIFQGTSQIGGWNYWEILFLLGIHELIFLISWTVFNNNLNNFPDEIRLGSFDKTLLLPANKKFLISFKTIDLTGLGSLFNVIIILILSLNHVVLKLSFTNICLFIISLIMALTAFYLTSFLLSALSLYLIKGDLFMDWLIEMTDFDRFPAEIYSNWLKRFLLFGIPILFFAYIPAGIILGKVSVIYVLLGLLVNVWLYFISNLIWKKGLKHYQSVSS